MVLRGARFWVYFRKRWFRRLLVAGVSAGLLVLVLSSLPQMVNKPSLRGKIRDWAVNTLQYSSPASVGDVDLALRANGRTDFYIHDFELDTPDPQFDLPWLFVDTFRASAPFYTLFGGVRADPAVQVRDGVLRLAWNDKGAFNLRGLKFAEGDWQLPVMRHMNIGTIDFVLMKWRVLIDRPDLKGRLLLDGHLRVNADSSRLEFVSEDNSFELKTPAGHTDLATSCSVSRAEYDRRTDRITALSGAVKNLPLRLGDFLLPGLPLQHSAATLTGSIRGNSTRWVFDGLLNGLDDTGLPGIKENLGAQISWDSNPSGQQHLHLELRNITPEEAEKLYGQRPPADTPESIARPSLQLSTTAPPPVLALAAQRDPVNGWQTLSVFCSRLNLDQLAADRSHPWLQYLARNFRSARIDGEQVRLGGFELGRVALDLLPQNRQSVNIALNGEIAGGKLSLIAKGFPLSGEGRPQTVIGSLSIPNTGDTILRFSGLLPPVLQCSPISGSGELTLKYNDRSPSAPKPATDALEEPAGGGKPRSETIKDALQESSFSLRLALNNVTIPTITGGEMLQELAGIGRRMIELENLCRRAQVKALPALPLPTDIPEKLEFTTLQISYDIAPDGRRLLRGLVAVSPQIGHLEGVGLQGADGNLRIHFILKALPPALGTENPQLSGPVRAALAGVLNEQGLRIDCLVADKGSKVEALYLQDAFRVWSESFLKKDSAVTPPKQD